MDADKQEEGRGRAQYSRIHPGIASAGRLFRQTVDSRLHSGGQDVFRRLSRQFRFLEQRGDFQQVRRFCIRGVRRLPGIQFVDGF